jgi:hypothetical protein
MWGLGNLGDVSYRTLIAQFADMLALQGAQSLALVAEAWSRFFWEVYAAKFASILQRVQHLLAQTTRTPDEEDDLAFYRSTLSGGFCLGGYLQHERVPGAYVVPYDPTLASPAPVEPLGYGTTRFWGCPNLMERLVYGVDFDVYASILRSGKWNGTPRELAAIIQPHHLGQPADLPIREAIDWIHASIYTTIKTMKFSHLDPVCGGPVEIAVITTDRPFRWVRHKRFDAAIAQGGLVDA